jgi:decaprenylphospho-beta-D-erythro-pentofuranosid-2-ulose 2-reductase
MKWILILGAKSDIARACAHEFARNGYNVYLAGRSKKSMEADASDLKIRHSVKAETVELDILDYKNHAKIYNSLKVKPVIVLSAIGYLGDQKKAEIDAKEAALILETNFNGPVSFLNIAAEDFETRRSGTIIGISSVAGDRGRQSNYIYGSAKGGFSRYLEGLRHRLHSKGVNVLTVKPGFVRTAMTAGMNLNPKLTATPEQVATDIFKAYKSGKGLIYTLWFWRLIMLIIRHVPAAIFNKTKL